MSEAVDQSNAEIRMPGYELAEKKGPVPPAADVPLEEIVPVMPALFAQDRWQDYFARLREEDPVHFNEVPSTGRFWSLTKYDDIKAVDARIRKIVTEAADFAQNDPLPDVSELWTDVYVDA